MAEGVNVSGYYCTCDRCEGDDYFYEDDEPIEELLEGKIVDSGPIDMRPVENNNGN